MRRKKHGTLRAQTASRTPRAEPIHAQGYPSLSELHGAWLTRVTAPIAALGMATAALSGCAGLGFATPAMSGFSKPDELAPTADVMETAPTASAATPVDPQPVTPTDATAASEPMTANGGYIAPPEHNMPLSGSPPPPSTAPWIIVGAVVVAAVIGGTVAVVLTTNRD